MGDPRKIRRKYDTPSHPWQKTRIEGEIILKREYGLKNKQEIWRLTSQLKAFKGQLKRLNALGGAQADKEKEQLRNKLLSLGLITKTDPLETVLGLETKDLMERRLQTVLCRKNLARTTTQARQFIVHRHITVAGKKVTVPSYLVKVDEEDSIAFVQSSSLADPMHPERYEEMPKEKEVKKRVPKEEEEVAAFEEVPKDEEQLAKDLTKKEQEKAKEAKSGAAPEKTDEKESEKKGEQK
ncbi:30S ribosomal protein S4 [archaeon]|nr:30S ribosomal protein S4 [archaeon]MBL7057227.1 30S ribosomal protein S4 [Candidatus Woesearchaeota archaeon]